MRRIMEDVTDLVLEFNGSLSGEHGDGLVRSEWNRKMFGPVVYEAFRQVKRGFDPANVLNPGKIVDAPAMEENWRVPPGHVPHRPADGSRLLEAGRVLPQHRDVQRGGCLPQDAGRRDVPQLPRDARRAGHDARAGECAACVIGYQSSIIIEETRRLRSITRTNDKRLDQRAARTEVDRRGHGPLPVVQGVQDRVPEQRRSRQAQGRVAPGVLRASDAALGPPAGEAHPPAEPTCGAVRGDEQLVRAPAVGPPSDGELRGHRPPSQPARVAPRPLPEVVPSARHRKRGTRSQAHPVDCPLPAFASVVLLDDCFTTFQEPHIGRAAVDTAGSCWLQVELAGVCCGRAMISKGFLTDARKLAREGSPGWMRFAAAGVPILGLEPSCILTLADEWPELVPGPAAKRVAAAAEMADAWLARQVSDNGLSIPLSAGPQEGAISPPLPPEGAGRRQGNR